MPRLDLAALRSLTFETPDEERFPCLRLAREALAAGGGAATILNAANEVAVDAFIGGRITFAEIAVLVAETCDGIVDRPSPACVAEALALDEEAREFAGRALARRAGRII